MRIELGIAIGLLAGAIVAGGVQQVRVVRAVAAQHKAEEVLKDERAAAATAGLEAKENDAEVVEQHGQAQQSNELAYIEHLRRVADDARADVDRVERMRLDAEARAYRYRELSATGTDTIKYLADRLRRLEANTVEGADLVAEYRAFVARRDAQVDTLKGQISADRALMAGAH